MNKYDIYMYVYIYNDIYMYIYVYNDIYSVMLYITIYIYIYIYSVMFWVAGWWFQSPGQTDIIRRLSGTERLGQCAVQCGSHHLDTVVYARAR